jgi:hypothetical protein
MPTPGAVIGSAPDKLEEPVRSRDALALSRLRHHTLLAVVAVAANNASNTNANGDVASQ